MGRSVKAEVDGRLLQWARSLLRMSRPVAAKKLKVSVEQLKAWEEGTALPTVPQLRKIAENYGQSLAVFFLPEPPEEFDPDLPDYRRAAGIIQGEISPELALDIRTNAEKRETFLELRADAGEAPPPFRLPATLREDPEALGERLRAALGISRATQQEWRDERLGFNEWRAAAERVGALVFQTSDISLAEMRGYSIALYPCPVIVINRKDYYRARSFTLVHELCHLSLQRQGLCDLRSVIDLPPERQRVEVFCNAVAAAVLVPRDRFLLEDLVEQNVGVEWPAATLQELARRYSVSQEVILRRLLTLGRTTQEIYQDYREQLERLEPRRATKGFVPPPTDVLSKSGKPYTGEVLAAFGAGRITASDTSVLLGARLKHLDAIGALLES